MNVDYLNFLLYYTVDSGYNIKLSDKAKEDFNLPNLSPSLQVSAASELLRNAVLRKLSVSYDNYAGDSILSSIEGTDLNSTHIGIYTLITSVCMESYTIKYILGEDKSYLNYLNISDIDRIRYNISYLCYWLGGYRHYRFLVPIFRELDLAIGYARGQLNLIKSSSNLATSLDDLSNAQ